MNSKLERNSDKLRLDSFESKLNRLKEVVKKMEEGNLQLDDSLRLFEEGVSLYRNCNSIIKDAEQRITILLEDENGEMIEKAFEDFKGE